MQRSGSLWWLMISLLALLPVSSLGQIAEDSDADTLSAAAAGAADRSPETGEQELRELSAVVELMLAQTQAFRQEHGLEPVEPSSELTATAEYFAQYMARTNEYGHGADGQRPSQRATAHGYDYCLVSENIGHLFSSQRVDDEELARQFVDGWQQSPEHRKNMLEPAVTQIGMAIAQSESSGYFFAVQMFGRPESAAIRFEIVNQSQDAVRYQMGEQTFELPPQYTRVHKRCRTAEIAFLAAKQDAEHDDQQQPQTLQVRSGERLTVTQATDGSWQIEQERIAEPDSPTAVQAAPAP
jgi:uncharacterized protein YkwD